MCPQGLMPQVNAHSQAESVSHAELSCEPGSRKKNTMYRIHRWSLRTVAMYMHTCKHLNVNAAAAYWTGSVSWAILTMNFGTETETRGSIQGGMYQDVHKEDVCRRWCVLPRWYTVWLVLRLNTLIPFTLFIENVNYCGKWQHPFKKLKVILCIS